MIIIYVQENFNNHEKNRQAQIFQKILWITQSYALKVP